MTDTTPHRLLHTMIRVRDLDAAVDFYTRLLGMHVLSRKDFPGGEFTLAFLGYGPAEDHTVLELTHNWGQEEAHDPGDGFGHLAVACRDIYATCDRLREAGVAITREPGPMKHGSTVIAFVQDPDGYKVELIERE